MGQEGIGVFANTTAPITTPATHRRSEAYWEFTIGSPDPFKAQTGLLGNRGLGSLYARKQSLMHPTSVRSPYGPDLSSSSDRASSCLSSSHTVEHLSRSMTDSNKFIEIGAGEAAWQAPEQAGYIRTVTVTKEDGTEALEPQFISAPSEPWWNDYGSFRQDLKLKAKGFSIVPEFRMSENMDDYLKSDGKVADGFGFGLDLGQFSVVADLFWGAFFQMFFGCVLWATRAPKRNPKIDQNRFQAHQKRLQDGSQDPA